LEPFPLLAPDLRVLALYFTATDQAWQKAQNTIPSNLAMSTNFLGFLKRKKCATYGHGHGQPNLLLHLLLSDLNQEEEEESREEEEESSGRRRNQEEERRDSLAKSALLSTKSVQEFRCHRDLFFVGGSPITTSVR
jgi:hypothetical protein